MPRTVPAGGRWLFGVPLSTLTMSSPNGGRSRQKSPQMKGVSISKNVGGSLSMFMQESLVPMQRTIQDMQLEFKAQMQAVDGRLSKIEAIAVEGCGGAGAPLLEEVALLKARVGQVERGGGNADNGGSGDGGFDRAADAAVERELRDLRTKLGQLGAKVDSVDEKVGIVAEGTPPSSPRGGGAEQLASAAAAMVAARKLSEDRFDGGAPRTESLASSKFRGVAVRVSKLEQELAQKVKDAAQSEARHAEAMESILRKMEDLEAKVPAIAAAAAATGPPPPSPFAPPPSPSIASPQRTGSSFGNGGFEQPLHWRETLLMRLEAVERRDKEQVVEVGRLGEVVEHKLREAMGSLQAISDNNETRAESLMEWTKFQLELFAQKLEAKFDHQFGGYQEAGRLAEVRLQEGLQTLRERETAWTAANSQMHRVEKTIAQMQSDAMQEREWAKSAIREVSEERERAEAERERVRQRERSADLIAQQRLELEQEEKGRSEDGWRAAIERLSAKQARDSKSLEHGMHEVAEEIRTSQAQGLMEIVGATTKAAQALDVARELEQEMIAREEEIEHLIHETIRGDKLQQSDKMAELEAATLGVTTAQTALSEKVEQVVIQAVAEREKASAQLASEVQTTLVAKEEQLESLGQSVQEALVGFRAVIMDHEESAEERAEKRVGALREALEAKYASLDAAMKQQALAQAKSIAILHDGVNALSASQQEFRDLNERSIEDSIEQMMSGMNQARIKNQRDRFREADGDGNGHLTVEELQQLLLKMGRSFAENMEDVQSIMRELDTDADGVLTEDEFVRVLNGEKTNGEPLSQRAKELLMAD